MTTLQIMLQLARLERLHQTKGGASTCSILEEPAIIIYDRMFNAYTHNGDLIIDLELFIAKCLELKMNITIKELS